jgi:quinol-cytochrome oxidoreductase complex cytochrome b subunit
MKPAFWFSYSALITSLIILGVYATGEATKQQIVILSILLFGLFFFISVVIELAFRQYRERKDYYAKNKNRTHG